jgi:hypothetical protein
MDPTNIISRRDLVAALRLEGADTKRVTRRQPNYRVI